MPTESITKNTVLSKTMISSWIKKANPDLNITECPGGWPEKGHQPWKFIAFCRVDKSSRIAVRVEIPFDDVADINDLEVGILKVRPAWLENEKQRLIQELQEYLSAFAPLPNERDPERFLFKFDFKRTDPGPYPTPIN